MAAQSLIPVFSGSINHESIQLVDARILHKFLGVDRDFSTWIKGRISRYGFVEGQDYLLTFTKTGERKNVKVNHYHLTLDMAKELSMVERNEKGRQARRYFIDCEKKLHQVAGTIGKPGHKCLSDLIEGKTSHLMGKAKVSAKSRLWAQVRKAYGVDVAADIPADQLDSARQFVGSYVLEGDYLPADQKQLPLQDEAPEYHYQEFGKTFHDGQLIIKELKKYVPQDAHMLLRQLDAVLVSGWTVMDESLMRLNMTRSMLSKWRGEAMGHIKHRL